jgi:isopenicillin-N epimerase
VSGSEPSPLLTTDGLRGREEFSLDRAQKHLNHGSYGAVPTRTIEFQAFLKARLETNPFRWFENLPAMHEETRSELAEFVGAPAGEIAMAANASAAASVVFGSVILDAKDEVLITGHIYGAVAMGAARYARRTGAALRTVSVPLSSSSTDALEVILSAITPSTRMILVDHISSATARLFPVRELVEGITAISATSGSRRDIIVVIDGAHALGLLPSPAVRARNVIWFGNLHKYACAPRGAAILVAQGELADALYPVIDSWGAELAYPHRFDLQGSIDTTGFLAAPHAVDTMNELFGWDRIRQYSAELGGWAQRLIAEALAPLMEDNPIPDVGMPVAQQPLVQLPRGVAADGPGARSLKDRLAQEANCEVGISTWRGTGFLRVSAHAYSEASDFEHFVEHGIPVIASFRSEGRMGEA